MPVEIRWHKENAALYVCFSGDITVEELVQSGMTSAALIGEDNPLPVHQIVDVSTLGSFPTQISGLGDLVHTMKRTHKQSWYIVVGARPITNFVGSVVSQMAGVNCKMVKTLDEAERFVDHLTAMTSLTAESA